MHQVQKEIYKNPVIMKFGFSNTDTKEQKLPIPVRRKQRKDLFNSSILGFK